MNEIISNTKILRNFTSKRSILAFYEVICWGYNSSMTITNLFCLSQPENTFSIYRSRALIFMTAFVGRHLWFVRHTKTSAAHSLKLECGYKFCIQYNKSDCKGYKNGSDLPGIFPTKKQMIQSNYRIVTSTNLSALLLLGW